MEILSYKCGTSLSSRKRAFRFLNDIEILTRFIVKTTQTTSLMETPFITNASERLALSSSQLNRSFAKWTRAASRKITKFRWTRIFITNPPSPCNASRDSLDAKLSGIFIRRFISRSYPGPYPRECRTRKSGNGLRNIAENAGGGARACREKRACIFSLSLERLSPPWRRAWETRLVWRKAGGENISQEDKS